MWETHLEGFRSRNRILDVVKENQKLQRCGITWFPTLGYQEHEIIVQCKWVLYLSYTELDVWPIHVGLNVYWVLLPVWIEFFHDSMEGLRGQHC